MSEVYKSEKIKQHNTYYIFLVMMCVLIVSIGAIGLIGYFSTGEILYTLFAAFGILICILAMLSNNIRARIIYPIRGM